MFYCARYGRRVREQVLAFGIFPDIDRNSPTCQCNGVSTATDISPSVSCRSESSYWTWRHSWNERRRAEIHIALPSTGPEHSGGDAGLLPHHFQPKPERNLERRSNPRRVERKLENFYVLQPVRTVGSTIVESDEKRGHKERRIHLPLHPHGGPDE